MVGTDKDDDLSMRLTVHRLLLLMAPVSSCNRLKAEPLCATQIGLLRKGLACLELSCLKIRGCSCQSLQSCVCCECQSVLTFSFLAGVFCMDEYIPL